MVFYYKLQLIITMVYMRYSILLSLMFFLCHLSYGLNVGKQVLDLNGIKWLNGSPISSLKNINDKKENDKIYVVFFWATYSNSSSYMIDFINKEKRLYEKDNIVFIGISTESMKEVKDFLEEKGYSNDISLGVDPDKRIYREYLKSTENIPIFFIVDGNGKLVWKGAPFEVNRILSRVINKTFIPKDQKKIEDLRKRMRKFAHIFDYKNKHKIAKRILRIDPTDITAVNVIVDEYIKKNRMKNALEFLSETRKKAENNKFIQIELFYIELGIIERMKPEKSKTATARLCTNVFNTFYNDSKILNEFTLKIINNIPFPLRPLDVLLKMAKRAIILEKVKGHTSTALNLYYQTLAEVYYWLGWTDKAVKLQREATILMIGEKTKKLAFLRYQYYKKVLKLKQKLQ